MEEDTLALIANVLAGEPTAWTRFVEHVYPQVEVIVRRSRSMGPLRESEDHRRSAATLVLSKLSRNDRGALRLVEPWLRARPEKTFADWLRIVATHVVRDYVTSQLGSPGHDVNKRMLHTLASALPESDQGEGARPHVTDEQTARVILEYAEEHLSGEQMRALQAWLQLGDYKAVAAALGVSDPRAAERHVRAALAKLRREFSDSEES